MHVKHTVNDYNRQLRLLNIRDHQVEYARFSIPKVIFTLLYRLGKLIVLAVFTLPGLILFAPVFIAAKVISIRKSREALAASTVKIQGRDVMATWKLLVALAIAPILYAFYTILFTYLTYHNRLFGLVPAYVPLWSVVLLLDVVFPATTFAALRFGEIGMDIFKSLRPLVLSLNPSGSTLVRLREQREKVSHEVTDLINTFGPEMFPDFDSTRIIADPFASGSPTSPTFRADAPPPPHQHHINNPHSTTDDASSASPDTTLPRTDSFSNLSSIGVFATRPPSRSRSRSSSAGGLAGSAGFPVKGFSTLASGEEGKSMDFDEVSKKIRGAMRERGLKRRKGSEELSLRSTSTAGTGLGSSWDLAGDAAADDASGVQTPATQGSDEGVLAAAEGKKSM